MSYLRGQSFAGKTYLIILKFKEFNIDGSPGQLHVKVWHLKETLPAIPLLIMVPDSVNYVN